MNTQIIRHNQSLLDIVNIGDNKDYITRIRKYETWLNQSGQNLMNANLDAYKTYLVNNGLSAGTVNNYIGTIRKWYKQLSQQRDFLYSYTDGSLPMLERKAYVDEIVTRLLQKADPANSKVKVKKQQDVSDQYGKRLTKKQVHQLLQLPDTNTLSGIRNLAILSVFISTGIRRQELINLTVDDLFHTLNGEHALLIRDGKGSKTRLVPYGGMSLYMENVTAWLDTSGIQSGILFRRIYKGGKSFNDNGLSAYGLQTILEYYPINDNNKTIIVKPHDLRRTYARLCFDAGMSVYMIQQNLGHENEKTTKLYIGAIDSEERKPPNILG